ncbi:MAG TPA: dual specificity protein phosphatase family protein [Nitrososphaerales archaeon]|nr:dual specificity protein phosphatase family protein [Nitrososphaerales archaeon]
MGTGGVIFRKIRAGIADEPTGFAWIEKGRLAATGFPAGRNQVLWLTRQGVTSILTLTEDPLPSEWTSGLNLDLKHVGMGDHAPPSLESLNEGADYIQEELARGRCVAVHCLAGEGRTGSVLAAFMIKERGLSSSEALRMLREIKPAFVEHSQEKAVSEFEASVRK